MTAKRTMPVIMAAAVVLAGVPGLMTTPAKAAVAPAGGPPQAISPYSPTGSDVSYPQCGAPLPVDQAFAIVGVNYGLDNSLNPCLREELDWAEFQTTGDSKEPNVSVYLNTGDPGNSYLGEQVTDWPSSGSTPYGSCLPSLASLHYLGPGEVSVPCAYEYGFQKAEQDLFWLQDATVSDGLPTAPGNYATWLDVETSNSWESDTDLNVADLQGMTAGLQLSGVSVIGIYALPQQWREITGGANALAFSSVPQLQDWILGAGSLHAARAECQKAPFAGASIALAQFPLSQFDGDFAC
ncbi:MAG: hypothetical protein WCB86_08665 [Candidatus Dormiibacterota bacterium]